MQSCVAQVLALQAGLDGFYAFDLMPATYARNPALLVAQQAGLPASTTATVQALYCDVGSIGIGDLFP